METSGSPAFARCKICGWQASALINTQGTRLVRRSALRESGPHASALSDGAKHLKAARLRRFVRWRVRDTVCYK